MTNEEQNKADFKRVEDVVAALGDHFDTVQVFVTRHEAGSLNGTQHIANGAGNWFSRYGQISCWMSANEQEAREHGKKYHREQGE